VPLRENIIRALVAIAEHERTRMYCGDLLLRCWQKYVSFVSVFRNALLIVPLVLLDAELLYRCEGIRVQPQTLADGPSELGTVMANVFLTIIDNPRTRAFLHLEVGGLES
jgi:hypothetical protein